MPERSHDPTMTPRPTENRAVLIEFATLYLQMHGSDAPALLDVRWKLGDSNGREHYLDSHIPGAVYVDLDSELAAPASPHQGRHPLPARPDLQRAARGWGIHVGQRVVVYDDNSGMSAARAWWLLRWAGVEDVKILDGGISAWKRSGFPVAKGHKKPAPGDVTLSSGHMPVLSADEASEMGRSGVLLDARAAERYLGNEEPIDPRAGHIPGAMSLPTAENLAADGRFLDRNALRAKYDAFGLADHDPVGVYCGSGVTAAHLTAALNIAGIQAALFPGSWSAWSSDASRRVAVGADPGY